MPQNAEAEQVKLEATFVGSRGTTGDSEEDGSAVSTTTSEAADVIVQNQPTEEEAASRETVPV